MNIDDVRDEGVRALYVSALNEYRPGESASEAILWPELERLWDGDHSTAACAAVRDALLVLRVVRRHPELALVLDVLNHEPTDDVTAEEFEDAIRHVHGCASLYMETVAVREVLDGRLVWKGNVRVFELRGHPDATRCYAWSDSTTEDARRFVAILDGPVVDSAASAVRAYVLMGDGVPRAIRLLAS